MKKLMTALEALKNQSVLVLGHEAPDGDCIGSSIAMGYLLKKIGADVVVINKDPVPYQYRFLEGEVKVERLDDLSEEYKQTLKHVVIVDSADLFRVGFPLKDLFPSLEQIINVDHHVSNTSFGTLNYIKTLGATAEIVANLYLKFFKRIESAPGTALYTGIMTDTGNLTYESTTDKTVSIVSKLYAMGADTNLMRREVYEKESFQKLEALKVVLERLSLAFEGQVAYTYLDLQTIQQLDLSSGDMEGYVDYPRKVNTAEVALFFKEFEKDVIKVSVRTKVRMDANQLAQYFGGGGHLRAAGFRKKGELKTVIEEVLSALEDLL